MQARIGRAALTRLTTILVVLGAAGATQAASLNPIVYQPSPWAGDLFNLRTSRVAGDLSFSAGLNFHYTQSPLAFEGTDALGRTYVEHTVKNRMLGEVLLSFAPIRFFDIGLAMPFVLSGEGSTARFTGTGETGGFQVGELRFSAKGVPFRNDFVGIALVGSATFPTGDEAALVGNGWGGGADLVIDFDIADRVGIAINAGAYFRAEEVRLAYLTVDHDLSFGLGGDVRIIDGLYVLGEFVARTALTDPFGDENLSMAEGLGGVRYQPLDSLSITAGAGGGTPIFAGWGTSQYRAFLDVRYTYAPVADSDGDGVVDADDECEIFPEDVDGFQDEDGCPDPDNDGDGLLDGDDRCPDEAEDFDQFEDGDGCVDPDNDGDGVNDAVDECVLDPEDRDGYQDGDGCPDNDNDNDGVPDADDACPDVAESVNAFKDDDGCPDFPGVSHEGDRILLAEKLLFDPKTHDVAPDSFEILRNLARFLQSRPDWARVRIDLHASAGKRAKLDERALLTGARAQALLRFLVTEGIEPSRLQLRSVGIAEPISATAELNERVELFILAPGRD